MKHKSSLIRVNLYQKLSSLFFEYDFLFSRKYTREKYLNLVYSPYFSIVLHHFPENGRDCYNLLYSESVAEQLIFFLHTVRPCYFYPAG